MASPEVRIREATIHQTAEGGYHPAPGEEPGWVVRDARGFTVIGPPCDRCGACECAPCECHGGPIHERGCVGLSFAYVRLDWRRSLCERCGGEEGITVVPCPCPPTEA